MSDNHITGRGTSNIAAIWFTSLTSGTYTATLKIDNTVVDTKSVTLAAGSSQVITFTDIPTDVAGSYTVDVDGLSGTFMVEAIINWWLVGRVIAAGVLIGVLISFWIRRSIRPREAG